jgi:CubicO group peptidase (beta-lactamase class C family)
VAILWVAAPARADKIDELARLFVAKHHVPGLSIAVVERGRIVKSAAYGVASVEHDVKATPQTLFQLDSTNKLLTATAIMQLVEKGKLGLDDPVSRHLDGTPAAWRDVTIRHLLTHTSGIKDDYAERFHGSSLIDYQIAHLSEYARKQPLEFAPGTHDRYNNLAFFLLTLVVERAAGVPYVRYMQEHILEPAGMRESSYADREVIVPHLASSYTMRDGKLVFLRDYLASQCGYSYALKSTADDLARFAIALESGRLLSAASVEQMKQPFVLKNAAPSRHGMAWAFGWTRGHPWVDKGGRSGAELLRYRDRDLAVVVLGNLDSDVGVPYESLARAIGGSRDPAVAPRTDAPAVPDPDRARTEQLIENVRQLAKGAMPGTVNPRWAAAVSADERAQMAAALAHLDKVEFLGSEEAPRNLVMFELPVAKIRYCRLTMRGRPLTLGFYLTADNRIATVWME